MRHCFYDVILEVLSHIVIIVENYEGGNFDKIAKCAQSSKTKTVKGECW